MSEASNRAPKTFYNGCWGYTGIRINLFCADERQRGQHHQREVGPRLLRMMTNAILCQKSLVLISSSLFRSVPSAEEGHDVNRTSRCARIRLRRTRRAELLLSCGRSAARGVSHLEIGQAVDRQGQGTDLIFFLLF